jgi:hypothetical protein
VLEHPNQALRPFFDVVEVGRGVVERERAVAQGAWAGAPFSQPP